MKAVQLIPPPKDNLCNAETPLARPSATLSPHRMRGEGRVRGFRRHAMHQTSLRIGFIKFAPYLALVACLALAACKPHEADKPAEHKETEKPSPISHNDKGETVKPASPAEKPKK